MMHHNYFLYITSAYGMTFIVLTGLVLKSWLARKAALKKLKKIKSPS